MQPQTAEGKTPPNVLQFGGAREPFAPSSDQAAREPGLEIHEHELLRRIGRGAYGEVWLARNALGTCRAIKIVYRKDFEDSRPFEREFAGIQKFEPISRSHPGLVNILQIGRREDYFYYVMELADGAEDPNAETRNPNQMQQTICGIRPAPSLRPSTLGLRTCIVLARSGRTCARMAVCRRSVVSRLVSRSRPRSLT
jgi:hypothetical protein